MLPLLSYFSIIPALLYERPGTEINTQCKDKRKKELKRCAKQKKGDRGERKEKRKEEEEEGGKKGAYVALLTRNTDEAPQ